MASLDSFECERDLTVDDKTYSYFDLNVAEENGLAGVSKLPRSLKVLLENLLRHEDGVTVKREDIVAIAGWLNDRTSTHEIAYRPARVLMQDFTGVPAVVDLAAMRDAMVNLGGNAEKINPLSPVHLIIDHSVMVDYFGTPDAYEKNVQREYERNGERYDFLKWGQIAFDDFKVVPPGTGICHQVNLEHIAQTVWTKTEGGKTYAFPDTLVGTDSHTTMINGLSVLGWGVGGIEAEAAMLGQPVSMLIPEVVGFELKGRMPEGATATDLVLKVVEMLRIKGVVGKFVEFYGEGLDTLSLEDQATAYRAPNMARPAAFSRWTLIHCAISKSPGGTSTGSIWLRPIPKCKGSGATKQNVSIPIHCASRWRMSARLCQAPNGRRTGSTLRGPLTISPRSWKMNTVLIRRIVASAPLTNRTMKSVTAMCSLRQLRPARIRPIRSS